MAELILTDAERAANSWLDLDDAAIGRLVKHGALTLIEGESKRERLWWYGCALVLCNLVADSNGETMTVDIDDLTLRGEPRGNWRVTIERTDLII